MGKLPPILVAVFMKNLFLLPLKFHLLKLHYPLNRNSINETLTCFLPSSATDIINNIDMEPSDFDEAYKVSKLQDLNNHRYTSSK